MEGGAAAAAPSLSSSQKEAERGGAVIQEAEEENQNGKTGRDTPTWSSRFGRNGFLDLPLSHSELTDQSVQHRMKKKRANGGDDPRPDKTRERRKLPHEAKTTTRLDTFILRGRTREEEPVERDFFSRTFQGYVNLHLSASASS